MKNNSLSSNKTFLINIMSAIFVRGISFLSAPFFTRIIVPEQYGNITLFESYVSILGCFAGLGVSSTVSIAKYKFNNEYDTYKYSNFIFGLIITIILSFVLCVLKPYIGIFKEMSFNLFLCVLLEVISTYVIDYITNMFVFEKKAVKNFFFSLIVSILSCILSLYLVYYYSEEAKYFGKIYGHLLVILLIATFAIIYILLFKKIHFKKEYIVFALSIGLPQTFHLLSGSLLSSIDKIMMKNISIDSSIIGIYGVMLSFSNIFVIIIDTFNISWLPYYYDYLDKKIEDLNNKCFNYIEIVTVIACGFMLLSKEVGQLYYGVEYHNGLCTIPILTLGFYFVFLYRFLINYEFYYKNNKFTAIATFISGLFSLVLDIILLPKYGLLGACASTLLSYILLFLCHYIFVNKCIEKGFHIKIIQLLPYILIVCLSVFISINIDNWQIRWLIGLIFGLYELIKIIKRKAIY